MKITFVSKSSSPKKFSPKKFKPSQEKVASNWFHRMSEEEQDEYLKEHPNSKYAKKGDLLKQKHAERKARTGNLSQDLDPRFKKASEGLDKNLLKDVSKLDEDLQQVFAEKFSAAMDEFNLDADSEETTNSLKFHRTEAVKAKKALETATNSLAKKRAMEAFKRERSNYRELKLAQQKAQDIMKTPGALNKHKNEIGRKILSKLSKYQADSSI